ncbi:glycosyltransferase [Brachybacterium sacelli]|uniref:Glycosyltransferase involved in cell wall biosynthesis n=1 Tax=Brachybacterium sacelli TaxID=173364 RepID=A0ABS4X274_9MICO|nr:glycosyltransferase [Brachybacterium sacelli]MBP2382559.1 glycosyltransferase involved in cell wall biosynthesis [Brachybacterium sacelli]
MSVIVVRPQAGGGLAAHVEQELAELAEAGLDVREAPVHIQDRPRPLADLRTVRTLRRCVRTAPAPVAVHAHGLRAGALAACAMPRGDDAHLVVTLHNRTVGSLPVRTLGAVLLRVLSRRAQIVLAVSPDLAEDARRAGAGEVRHAVIPAPEAPAPTGMAAPGPAPEPSVPIPGAGVATPDDTLEVLVVARLAPQKGLDDLLDAAALLDREAVRIRVAGDGPLHGRLSDRIRAEQLSVELLGRRQDVPALLESADLVVSAALWEGQPVSLQEALRAGRAIVATDAGGTRWVTAEAAQLVPSGDPVALAEAISAHRDPERRRDAQARSRRRARELPTARDMVRQLTEILVPPGR